MQESLEYRNKPGRPPRPGGTDPWKVYVPTDLANFHRLVLADPVTGKIPNGALSSLVERLLREEARKLGYRN
jgi:hypothetical protein